MTVSPTSTVWSVIVPTGSGARLWTTDWKVCVAARPSGSAAATVTWVAPLATAAMVTVDPEIETVATPVSDDEAVYVRVSPSGSWKYGDTSTATVCPTTSVLAGREPAATGARLGTVTSKFCCAERPSGSVAMTVMSAVPATLAVIETTRPATEAETAVTFELAAE